jgi:ATP-dependent helicase/DNAse subunit B
VARAAVERFLTERERLREQIDAVRALEERARVAETVDAPRGTISYTQLETYRACPHRYYLRYVVGLPGLPDRRSVSIGLAFHHAIAAEAERRRAGLAVSPWFVHDLFTRDPNLAEIEPAPPSNGAASEHDPIAAYLASVDAEAEPLLIEEAFSLRLGEATLRGVVDRVQRLPDGTMEVVDYKTDRRARTPDEVRTGWQLPIYLLACRDVFTEIQPAPLRATMFFVRQGARVTVEYTPEHLDAIHVDLTREATRLHTARPGDHRASPATCRFCEYRLTCRHSVGDGQMEYT